MFSRIFCLVPAFLQNIVQVKAYIIARDDTRGYPLYVVHLTTGM